MGNFWNILGFFISQCLVTLPSTASVQFQNPFWLICHFCRFTVLKRSKFIHLYFLGVRRSLMDGAVSASPRYLGIGNLFFKKNGPNPASFYLFSFFSHDKYTTNLTKNYKSVDSNPGWQDCRRRRIQWAMAAPHWNCFLLLFGGNFHSFLRQTSHPFSYPYGKGCHRRNMRLLNHRSHK